MSEKIIHLNEAAIKSELKELVRSSVEETLNELLEQEAQALTNAERYERTENRQEYRSGRYEQELLTSSGEVTLKMPKLKGVTFKTAIIERYRRRESSVEEALIEMYLAGVSIRRVEDITDASWGTRVSAGTVSELIKKVYVHIDQWRSRPLFGSYPYVYLDGIYLKRIQMFHTDRGSEFDNTLIDELLESFQISRSLSMKGCPYDNAVAESTFKMIKAEFVSCRRFDTLDQLQLELADYVHWFNNIRLHGMLGYLSPAEFKITYTS